MVKPYLEHDEGRELFRLFSSCNEEDLVWHRDVKSRWLHIIQGGGWKIQMDDGLPHTLRTGDMVFIPKMTYHRVIQGSQDLAIRITQADK